MDNTWSPAHQERTKRFSSASLTHWVAAAPGKPKDGGEVLNLWSVLVMDHQTVTPGTQRVSIGRGRAPETIPGTDRLLVRVHAEMPSGDVDQLLTFRDDTFIVPAMARETRLTNPVRAPGSWLPPRALAEDAVDRKLLPWLPGMVWMSERDVDEAHYRTALGDAGIRFVIRCLRDELGVDLTHQPDRLGSVLVAWPENRIDVRACCDTGGTKIGGHVRLNGIDGGDLTLTAQAYNGDELASARVLSQLGGMFVVDMGTRIDRYAVQVFHKSEGLVFADGGIPMRQIDVRGNMMTGEHKVAVQPRNEEGEAVGAPSEVALRVGAAADTTVGNVQPWERRRRETRARIRRERMHQDGTLKIFTGRGSEREAAIAYVQGLVATHHQGPLRIWDEYFSGDELLMIVGALQRSSIPLQILSGEARVPVRRNARITYAGVLPEVEVARPSISDAVRGLDQAGQRAGVTFSIEHRYGGAFHDRFIITDTDCYQLGTSLNSLGRSFSTVLRLPDRMALVQAFEDAWMRGGKA